MTTRREFWLALCWATRLRAQDEPEFTAAAQDVPVDTAVTRNQRPLRGLRAEDFRLLENGQPRPIRSVTTEELPLDIVLIFHAIHSQGWDDPRPGLPPGVVVRSGSRPDRDRFVESMSARMINGAANVLIPTRPEDRVAFLVHASPPRIELPFTNSRDAMAAALRRIGAMDDRPGFSELVTFESAVRMLAELSPAPGRRRLIVRLGTVGAGHRYADEPVIRRLWSENIIFSAVEILAPGGGFNPGLKIMENSTGMGVGPAMEPNNPGYRISNPYHIAQATGGDAIIFLDPQDPEDLITRLRLRYILWFRQPEGLEPGQQRSVSVELSPEIRMRYPDAVVQARSGYVAGSR